MKKNKKSIAELSQNLLNNSIDNLDKVKGGFIIIDDLYAGRG